jgi:hypothetical protein
MGRGGQSRRSAEVRAQSGLLKPVFGEWLDWYTGRTGFASVRSAASLRFFPRRVHTHLCPASKVWLAILMHTARTAIPRRRFLVAVIGVSALVVLYQPLELDDLPYGLRAGGKTAPVLWAIAAALWIWAIMRFDALAGWAERNRVALLRTARWLSLYWAAIFVALFYVMWIAGRLSLGRWPPRDMMDDPKGILPCAVLYMAICGWFWLFPLALAVPHFVRAQLAPHPKLNGHIRDFIVTVGLIAAAAIWWDTDPHSLVRWFKD